MIRQVQAMYLFDDLIGNVDRNVGDIVIDAGWKLCMIDHSRAFQSRFAPRYLYQIRFCRRDLRERLLAVDADRIRSRVGNVLTGPRIDALLDRGTPSWPTLQRLIDDVGEGAVLYGPSGTS